VRCAIAALAGPDGDAAAAWLSDYAGTVPRSGSAAEDAFAAAQALIRYQLRVRDDPAACAETARLAYPNVGNDLKRLGWLAVWRCRCLHRAGRPDELLPVLDALLARAEESRAARPGNSSGADELLDAHELAADVLVHERLHPARAEQELRLVLDAAPGRHWAHYLLARLLRSDPDRREEARRAIARAGELAPANVLYRRMAGELR